MPDHNLRALAADLGLVQADRWTSEDAALAPPLLISEGAAPNIAHARQLITETLTLFFQRGTKVSTADGRRNGVLACARVNVLRGSEELSVIMRNPAEPVSIDADFGLRNQSALEPQLVQLGFERALVALRRASRLHLPLDLSAAILCEPSGPRSCDHSKGLY